MRQLRRLKVMAVYVPITAILLLEVFRVVLESRVEGEGFGRALREQLVPAVIAVVSVIAFSLVMYASIARVQRALLRQNRELAVVNAVSTAVQGEVAVDDVIDAVIVGVIESTGAGEVSVTVFDEAGGRTRERSAAAGSARRGSGGASVGEPSRVVDVPLSTTSGVVGRMRLAFAGGVGDPELLAATTLQNIGHQLASSIQTAQLFADLRRRQREGHALYDVLVRISDQGRLADILSAIVRHASDRLEAEEAVVCLGSASSRLVEGGDGGVGAAAGASVCLSSVWGGQWRGCANGSCARRSSPVFAERALVAVADGGTVHGELCVGRSRDRPFTGRDRELLGTLADLASIAITNAGMREHQQLAAIRGERERIARELHDSLAQVLGVTQLRLRALLEREEIGAAGEVAAELEELAEISGDAYHDVREAILGLRESTRAERGLIEGLTAYLEKYERQNGIRATLETRLEGELVLAPRSEIQVIRVVQEALTNVRKHSGAKAVTVRIESAAGQATFVVEDDGAGFDPAAAAGRDSFGLQSMRERIALVGGSLTVEAAPGSGCRVSASVPDSYQPAAI